ncbi:potassium-transporting ATPase subunit KdpC [Aureimonas psammosilenae]|uniref:potassium-transporting ATPase subunit KdpC n=1 Tax=Aureimonas psammosilenae TaxID=2495496 RepID=UPI001260ECAF|nr:potassium-transporting ATPase subunit KdpC [Aureimonas psammosilenae]
MIQQFRAVATLLGILTLLLGLLYPAAMTVLAGALFPAEASGSLVSRNGQAVGSTLIGQSFAGDGYFHPRASAAGNGYDASASSGTNLAPTSAKLAERLKADGAAMRQATGAATLPGDAITTSGSGLDPDISPAFAALQVPRIAATRGIDAEAVGRIVTEATAGRTFGILGEPRVNVLSANLALDALAPTVPAPTPETPLASAPSPAG